MTTRILSGVIAPSDTRRGTATIVFDSHTLSGTVKNSGPDHNRITVGPNRDFKSKPAFTVSLREVIIHESPDIRKRALGNLRNDRVESDHLGIWTNCKSDHLTVGWHCDHDTGIDDGQWSSTSEIIELSYMIIGEVE